MSDGYKTRQELVERALGALGVLAAGQAPATEDVNLIDGLIEPTLAALSAREVLDGIDPDSIPDEFFRPLGQILARDAATDFGIAAGSPEDPGSLEFKAAKAEADLRIMQRSRPTYQTQTAEYF